MRTPFLPRFFLLAPAFVLPALGFPAVAHANPARGYAERACGFDLDDDGVPGEPVDDCRVCDGVTSDPDGDGVDEDLIYVDCAAGTDTASCGTALAPCGSVTHALESVADGPADGAEDIVCFTGTCAPDNVRPAFGGLPDTRLVAAAGSESREFELATDPAMLVGWDRDGDGHYPPYDDDDEAVLDGTGLSRAISMRNTNASHFELAHFEAREYGRVGNDGGFFAQGPSHHYLHDIELRDINREMPTPSGRIVFDFFSSQDNHYFWAKNIDCADCGGYFVRGAGGNGPAEAGPFRFQNISLSMHPCSYGSSAACDAQPYATVAKLWGYMRGVEFLDSIFDGDPTNRTLGNHPSHWPSGVGAVNCAQDFVIRNNTFRDTQGLFVQGYAAGFCDGPEARPTADVSFEDNYVVFETLDRPAAAVAVQPVGQVANANVGEVTIAGNVFRSTSAGGMRTCFLYAAGNAVDTPDAPLVFTDNRCEGSAGEAIRLVAAPNANLHPSYAIFDNVFAETDGLFFGAGYVPPGFESNFNVFGGAAAFRWGGGPDLDFEAYRAASGQDSRSTHCAGGRCVPPLWCGDEICAADEDAATCPDDCAVDDDEGAPGDGETGDDGDDDDGASGDATGTGGSEGEGGPDASGNADAGAATSGDHDGAAADPRDSGGDGCTCRARAGSGTPLAFLTLFGFVAARRRSER